MPRWTTSAVRLAAAAFAVGCSTPGNAQTANPPPSDPAAARVAVSAGYEQHRDRLRYEFENASSFNTPFLVPHKFVQTYVGDRNTLRIGVRLAVQP